MTSSASLSQPASKPAPFATRLRFSTEAPLQGPEASRYLMNVRGTLLLEGPPQHEIGSFWIRIVHASRAWDEGESLRDVCAQTGPSVFEHANAVYDLAHGDLRDDVFDEFSGFDVMILEDLIVAPQYRGHGLGLSCIRRAIDAFGHGLAGVVIKPVPLQFVGSRAPAEPAFFSGLPLDLRRATQRLRKYYGQLGFRPVSHDSDFFVLDLSRIMPRTMDLLAG